MFGLKDGYLKQETPIVLAGIIAGVATTFVASLPTSFEIKAPTIALATIVTSTILL